jgi:tripeptide aminopeptidase
VVIDTQAQEGADSIPSSAGQWTLARLLADDLRTLGAHDVRVSDSAIVYAHLPASRPELASLPRVGFLAHVDTSPAVSGRDVRPVVHRNYTGGDVTLPDGRTLLARAEHPELGALVGDDLITTDGTTLLGSDDKAGVATIMTMADVLTGSTAIAHGPIAIAFTADEEVGIGIRAFDVAGFGADFAYTVDGEALGEINHETWSARQATVTLTGVSAHPGSAKGLMVNSAYAMADLVLALPSHMRPETTEGREGFIHPFSGVLDVTTSVLKVLLRDFAQSGLEAQERLLRKTVADVVARHPGTRGHVEVIEQYRNMNEVLKDQPHLVEWALEATRRAGLVPVTRPIRGGTDGSQLTFRGLPCPNIFTGGHNFHSTLEFNSRRGLEKTTETLLHLVQIVAEHGDRRSG